MEKLQEFPFDSVGVVESPDPTAERGSRPNIIATIDGEGPALWIVSHMDIVPEGKIGLWNTDPFDPVVKDGRLYVRCDNVLRVYSIAKN